MKLGLKRKIVLVFVGVLAAVTVLDASLASYFTKRQNQDAAFATLKRDLLTWQDELQDTTLHMRTVALSAIGETVALNQLSELKALNYKLAEALSKNKEVKEAARTLAFSKSVSLNRLHLVLRSGGFSAISVYIDGMLSHRVSVSEVGMFVQRGQNGQVWVKAAADDNGNLPIRSWPAWQEGTPPPVTALLPPVDEPRVGFTYPAADHMLIEVAVPVEGVIDHSLQQGEGNPPELSVIDPRIAGSVGDPSIFSINRPVTSFAVVVFQKSIDQAYLQTVERKTGMWPLMLSPDGQHRQQLGPLTLSLQALLPEATEVPADIKAQTVSTGQDSFYAAALPWQFERQPGFVLALVASQDSTLQNIRQTLLAILTMTGLILAFSIGVGIFWVGRFIDPIIALTNAVNAIGLVSRLERNRHTDYRLTVENLRPLAISAPGEIGDLAWAFYVMIGELHYSFDTLEQRVQDRTVELLSLQQMLEKKNQQLEEQSIELSASNSTLLEEINERKSIEDLLRLREREFRSLAENSPDNIARYDRECRIKYMNSRLHATLGIVDDAIAKACIGNTPCEIYPDGRFDAYQETVKNVAESGLEAEIELKLPDTGDGVRYHLVRMVAERDQRGEVMGVLVLGRDITERKRMEAELLNQADFQQTILDAVADAGMQVMMIEEGRIIHVGNRKLAYEFGFTDADIDMHPMLTDIIHSDDRDRIMSYHVRRMAGEAVPASYELGLVTRSGERREYETAVAIVPGTSPARMITVGKDISDRKRMEAELISQADFQQTLLNAICDVGMQMMVIENGRMIHIGNRASAHKFGFTDEEIAARPSFMDFVHPDDRERVIGYHVSRMKGEAAPSSYELGLVAHNGERREFETSVAVVPGTDPVRIIAISKDITERKRMEEALANREQELRALAESSPGMMGCFHLRPDGIVCMPYVSANIRELFGLCPEDVADDAAPLLALNHQADAHRVMESIAESARTMTTWHMEYRILHPTRGERWMEGNTNPFPHPDGGIVWYGYVHDITERKQAEAEKQHLINILEQSADFIGSADMQGRLLYHNRAARRIVGLPEDADLSNMNIADMHPEWALKMVEEQGIPALLKDGVWHGEVAVRHRDGREIPVSQLLVLHRDGDGKPLFHSTIMRDITERKQAEDEIKALNASLELRVLERTEELRRQTRYLRTMIDTLPMMVWFKDTDSRFLVVNQGLAAACSHSVDSMVGKSDPDVWQREHAEAYRADDMEVMATGRLKTMEEPFVDAHNGSVWVETFKAPVLDEDGRVLGTVGVSRDISERRAVEAARETALAEAERLARLRSEFMARMSHELRTPLNGILGYTQVLQGEAGLQERHSVMVNVIQKSGEHLLDLINDILDFAKIEAGKQALSLSDVHLPVFLGNIAGIVAVNSEQKQLAFVYKIAEDVPEGVRADEMRLRQVLLNLLSNAVKYTERGEISLTVTALEPGRLRFKVRDTGIGIENEQLETIFRPFEQAGDSRNHSSGTGLGLVISRELVRLMGSEIFVTSQIGKGSCFWFDLDVPVVDVYREIMPVKQLASGYRGPKRRVLVVDDVDANRALLIDMLSRLGFETLEASNGNECLDSVGMQMPDLVLLDMVMPEMDGLEAARRLRSLPGFGRTPIIAVSASASGTDVAEALAAGVNAFLSKPIDMKRLMAQVGGFLYLDWMYALPEVDSSPQHSPDEWFEAPPREEMKVLHQMALEGSMRDIIRQTAYLEELDPRYRPFAGQLRKLSQDYQSKAVLDLVERYYQQE